MAPKTEPILDLKTVIERPPISIDGTLYEMRTPDDLPALALHQVGAWYVEIDGLLNGDDDSDQAAARLDTLLTSVVDRVLPDVPVKVRNKLSSQHKLAVVSAFTTLPRARMTPQAPAEAKPTGARSSRRSRASTEEAPASG